MRLFLALLFFSLPLISCVSPSLNDTSEFEEYALRPATDGEAKQLEGCLRSILHAENAAMEKAKNYIYRMSELKLDDSCSGLQLRIHKKTRGYNAVAQFHKNEETVRWIMDENGHVMEDAEAELGDDMVF